MGRTWQMPPFACAPSTIPRGPAPRSRTALRAGGEARYRCRPVIVTPQDGPAGEGCGLVAVASGVAAELFAPDGADVCEQPEAASTSATSAQPRMFSHFGGDPRAMSSGALAVAAFGLDACVPAPDALTVGQASKLAGDLLAVRLVLPADLPMAVPARSRTRARHALNSSLEADAGGGS